MQDNTQLKEIFRQISISKEETAKGIVAKRKQEQEEKKKSSAVLIAGQEITDDTDLDKLEEQIDRLLAEEIGRSTKKNKQKGEVERKEREDGTV